MDEEEAGAVLYDGNYRATCVLYVGATRQPNLVVEHCQVPSTLAPGELLLSLKLAAICPTDLRPFTLSSPGTPSHRREAVPRVPGHEAVGQVVLSRRTGVQPGERLVFAPLTGCGDCAKCSQLGHILDCTKLVRYGDSCFTASPGLSGSYSSHMVVRASTSIAKVPSSIPDSTALAASCRLAPLLWAVNRAITLLPQNKPKCALVQGCGMRGILSCAALLRHGFSVYSTDPDHARLRLAQKFGAHPIYGATENDELVFNCVPSGYQLVVRACGSRQVLGTGIAALAHGGTYLLLGNTCGRGDTGSLPIAAITAKALLVLGVPEHFPDGLQEAVDFLEATHDNFPYEALFSPAYSFSDIQAALRLASERKFHRVTLKTDVR